MSIKTGKQGKIFWNSGDKISCRPTRAYTSYMKRISLDPVIKMSLLQLKLIIFSTTSNGHVN
jgi:hypothetical protein